jgi:hypothetical protein
MSRLVVLNEIHVTVRVPAGLPEAEVAAVRRVVLTRAFLTRLRKAVHDLIARDLAARVVHVRVSF